MDRKRISILIALAVLALSVTACGDTGYTYSDQAAYVTPTPRLPSARELAAVETAQAEGTREALEDAAKSTADALALQEQATKQALSLKGTQRAQEAHATREAWEFSQTQEAVSVQATATAESRQATATRQALDATATAVSVQATITAAQVIANVQGTKSAADAFAVEATRRAVERADERERVTQPLRNWWAWALLAVALPALAWVGWRIAKVAEDRARVVKRKADEGEPFVLLEQTDKDGNKRIALPLRSFNALLDTGDVPALPSPEMQDATTMRQQTANAIQARQVAATVKARKAHKTKPPQIVAQAAPALPGPAQRRRRQIPGIVKVVGVNSLEDAAREGILPPQLAEAIEGEWHEVNGED